MTNEQILERLRESQEFLALPPEDQVRVFARAQQRFSAPQQQPTQPQQDPRIEKLRASPEYQALSPDDQSRVLIRAQQRFSGQVQPREAPRPQQPQKGYMGRLGDAGLRAIGGAMRSYGDIQEGLAERGLSTPLGPPDPLALLQTVGPALGVSREKLGKLPKYMFNPQGQLLSRLGDKITDKAPVDPEREPFHMKMVVKDPEEAAVRAIEGFGPFATIMAPSLLGSAAITAASGGNPLIGTAAGAAISRTLEGLLEAKETEREAVRRGMSPTDARIAADKNFVMNYGLLPMDFVELLGFMLPTSAKGVLKPLLGPVGKGIKGEAIRGLRRLGLLGAVSAPAEGFEEVVQAGTQDIALGDAKPMEALKQMVSPSQWSPEQQEGFHLGALNTMAFGGGVSGVRAAGRAKARLQESATKAAVDAKVKSFEGEILDPIMQRREAADAEVTGGTPAVPASAVARGAAVKPASAETSVVEIGLEPGVLAGDGDIMVNERTGEEATVAAVRDDGVVVVARGENAASVEQGDPWTQKWLPRTVPVPETPVAQKKAPKQAAPAAPAEGVSFPPQVAERPAAPAAPAEGVSFSPQAAEQPATRPLTPADMAGFTVDEVRKIKALEAQRDSQRSPTAQAEIDAAVEAARSRVAEKTAAKAPPVVDTADVDTAPSVEPAADTVPGYAPTVDQTERMGRAKAYYKVGRKLPEGDKYAGWHVERFSERSWKSEKSRGFSAKIVDPETNEVKYVQYVPTEEQAASRLTEIEVQKTQLADDTVMDETPDGQNPMGFEADDIAPPKTTRPSEPSRAPKSTLKEIPLERPSAREGPVGRMDPKKQKQVDGWLKRKSMSLADTLLVRFPQGEFPVQSVERLIRPEGAVGEEVYQRINRADSRAHGWHSDLSYPLLSTHRKLSKADREYVSTQFLKDYHTRGNEAIQADPNLSREVKAYANAWRQSAEWIGESAKSLGIQVRVRNEDGDMTTRGFYPRPPDNYVPRRLAPEVIESLRNESGAIYEALKGTLKTPELQILVDFARGQGFHAKVHGSLEHSRVNDKIPWDITLPGGEVLNLFVTDPIILGQHVQTATRRLAIAQQFGAYGSDAYFKEIANRLVNMRGVDPHEAEQSLKYAWLRLNRSRIPSILTDTKWIGLAYRDLEATTAALNLSRAWQPNMFAGWYPSAVRHGFMPAIKGLYHAWTTTIMNANEQQLAMLGFLHADFLRPVTGSDLMAGLPATEYLHGKIAEAATKGLRLTTFHLHNRINNQMIARIAHLRLYTLIDQLRGKRPDTAFWKLTGEDMPAASRWLQRSGFSPEEIAAFKAGKNPNRDQVQQYIMRDIENANNMFENAATRPGVVGHPAWRLIMAYTAFTRKQAKLTQVAAQEAGKGNVLPMLRLMIAGQIAGEAIVWARNWVMDREREDKDKILLRLANNMFEAGTAGLWGQLSYMANKAMTTPGYFSGKKGWLQAAQDVFSIPHLKVLEEFLKGLSKAGIQIFKTATTPEQWTKKGLKESAVMTWRPLYEAVAQTASGVALIDPTIRGRLRLDTPWGTSEEYLIDKLRWQVYTTKNSKKGYVPLQARRGREKNVEELIDRWEKQTGKSRTALLAAIRKRNTEIQKQNK